METPIKSTEFRPVSVKDNFISFEVKQGEVITLGAEGAIIKHFICPEDGEFCAYFKRDRVVGMFKD